MSRLEFSGRGAGGQGGGHSEQNGERNFLGKKKCLRQLPM